MTKQPRVADRMRISEPCTVVIFGASGDLTHRKLIPSLYLLSEDGLLHPETRVIGVARTVISHEDYVKQLEEGIAKYCRRMPASKNLWEGFARRVSYLSGEYDDAKTYKKLAAMIRKGRGDSGMSLRCLFYLAIPPTLYETVIEKLGTTGMSETGKEGYVRLIVEKPFGRDLASAQALNELIHKYYEEDQVYRIDHYLGKETVQNILTFRFANSIFEPIWNRNYIDNVQISVTETEGVGHRTGYYEHAGVLRDMFQNHLLQLLCLTAIEPPATLNAKALRDEKVKVLHTIEPVPFEAGVAGQYDGYRKSQGVNPKSRTPTFFAMRLKINSWRWQGVPFYLRSGKELEARASEIIMEFKRVPPLLFNEMEGLVPNILSLCIQPDEGMHLRFETKIPGAGMKTEPVEMDFHYGEKFDAGSLPDAYERLLLDALKGDASLFSRSDEIERAWEIIDPVIAGWESSKANKVWPYKPGSWGPEEAHSLLAKSGHTWNMACASHHLASPGLE